MNTMAATVTHFWTSDYATACLILGIAVCLGVLVLAAAETMAEWLRGDK